MSHANVRSTTHRRGCRSDGKSLVTTEVGAGDQWEPKSVHLVDLDGKERQVLASPKGWAAHGQLAPDGKRLLVGHEGGLAIVSVGKPETLTPVEGGPEHIERGEYDWSPDGKRIVFRRQKGTLQEPGDNELVVADPDGKNPTVIRKSKADGMWKVYWRYTTHRGRGRCGRSRICRRRIRAEELQRARTSSPRTSNRPESVPSGTRR